LSSRHLRVAVLGINYAPEKSGIAPYTAGVATGLRERGHDVEVFTSFPHYPEWRTSHKPPVIAREHVRGVPVTRLRHYVPSEPTGRRRALFEASFGARLLASRWGVPDVVLCVSPALISSALAIGRARLGWRRPAVGLVIQDLYSRGVEETGLGGGRLGSLATSFEGRVARSADGVAVIHDRFKQQVVSSLGVSHDRVQVIRNWTHISPVPDFDEAEFRASLGWRPGETVVLHAGAMGAKQALENVVEAARIADVRGDAVRFVLLGDGSQRRALESAAAGVRSINFLDPLGDKDFGRALVAADVLLVNERPGVTDMAVPSKLTSYFSAGRPVLAATDAGSTTAEEIRVSGGGVRVDAGAPGELLEAALRLGADKDHAQELGKSGLRYCMETLSEGTAIRQYDEWVRELATKKQTTG
jgi:colanic acid biosynthesis glycosyl transferase WcaI